MVAMQTGRLEITAIKIDKSINESLKKASKKACDALEEFRTNISNIKPPKKFVVAVDLARKEARKNKYLKRCANRNKLYMKRIAKYGKGL